MDDDLILVPTGAGLAWLDFCVDALSVGVTPQEINLVTLMYEEVERCGYDL